MPVTLQLNFPAGRYHATPWGRHVNEGVPEWPPSPWRLLRALIATWKRKCPRLSEMDVRGVLQQLVAPPCFYLPPVRVAHTRHAMPTNQLARNYKPSSAEKKAGKYQGDPTIVFDTFVAVGRRHPVVVHWPDVTLSPDESRTLEQLAANLATFGRAEGWVHAELVEQPALALNCVPSPAANTDQELVSVFCPDPETAFGDDHYPRRPDAKKLKKGLKPGEFLFDCPRWHLCLDTEIIHAERWPRVPGARWVSYARPADAFTAAIAPATQPPRRKCPTVARFLLDGPVLPLVVDMVRAAEAFRTAVMRRYQFLQHRRKYGKDQKQRREQFRSEVLSGKDAGGHYLPGHDHAHYLPTAEGDDPRRLSHVTVYAPRGFDEAETEALTGLRHLQVGDLELRIQLVGLGQPSDFRTALFGGSPGAASVWVSATPYIGPVHVGRARRQHDFQKAIRRELHRRPALEKAEVMVEEIADTDPAWGRRPRPFEFHRARSRSGDDGYDRPFGLFRLTFSAPVSGPLCLGYASHFGLGLFLPVGNTERPER